MRAVILAATVAALGLAGSAGATAAAAPTCATVGSATVKSELGVSVQTSVSSGNSAFGGLKYLDCSYGGATITYISPATGSGWNLIMSQVKNATIEKTVPGIGTAAFSGTGSSTSSTFANGKTTSTTVATENLWVYVGGKAIFEISVPKGNLTREELLAKAMVKLV